MNEYNINVDFTKGRISTNLRKLVQNDYNSTKLNFTFDKEGRVLFKMLYPDGTQYVDEIQNNELIFGKGVLHQEGTYEYEISLYSEDGRLTDYAVKSFEVRSELVDTDELVEPDDRVPILDNLINEANQINNIDIDIENSVITLKRKDGTTKVENVKGDKGDKGDAGSIKFIIANELPSEDIDESAIYMIPSSDPQTENTYQEYIYVNGTWESLGSASVQVDMTDYPTKEEMNNVIDEFASTIETPIFEAKLQDFAISSNSNSYSLSETDKAIIGKIITKGFANGYGFPTILLKSNNGMDFVVSSVSDITNRPANWYLTGFAQTLILSNRVSYGMQFINASISILGNWNEDVFTCTRCSISLDRPQYLSKANTLSYTPTSDYHPATKKYVDDKTVTLTQTEYDALTTIDENVYYFIVEE